MAGSVIGRGQSLRVGGFTGGLEYALTLGVALARAQGQQGNAQAQLIDLGVFGLILSQPGECTGTSPLPPEQVPRPLRVSSVKGERSATNRYADGRLVSGGSEYSHASPQPAADARTQVGAFEIPALISLDGLDSRASARIITRSELRDSVGSTDVGRIDIAGGLVRLDGLHWLVERVTGSKDQHTESFTVGRIALAGVPLPSETPEQIAESFEAINAALAGAGISIHPPVIDRRKDGTTEVTSLFVRIGGNDQANPVVGQILGQLQPARDELYAQLQSGGCPVDPVYVSAALTVFDITLASLTGSGGLTLEVGGARTLHDTTYYENPFGVPRPFTPSIGPVPVPPRAVPATPGKKPVAQVRPPSAGRTSSRCETTHPSGSPGCSRGSAAWAGAIALVVVAGLFAGDYLRTRRTSDR